jgi:hypothetical protein
MQKNFVFVWHFSNNQMPFPWCFVGCVVGLGGMQLGLFDRISELICGGQREPVKLLLNQHGWWPAMEPALLLLAYFSSRDKFWRFVHWIMLHICDKYTQIIHFPKESGCELTGIKLKNWFCKAHTWEMLVMWEYGIEPYISARYSLCQTGMAWFRFITSNSWLMLLWLKLHRLLHC